MGALSKVDEFLLNPQVRICSVAVPGKSRNNDSQNWKPTGDPSPGNPCSVAVIYACHSSKLNDSEQKESHHMVKKVQKEVLCCSLETSSGKQKKSRPTSQPQFRIENTLATMEADQILLALKQLTTNSTSAIFNNNVIRISKLPKSLTTIMPTFGREISKI